MTDLNDRWSCTRQITFGIHFPSPRSKITFIGPTGTKKPSSRRTSSTEKTLNQWRRCTWYDLLVFPFSLFMMNAIPNNSLGNGIHRKRHLLCLLVSHNSIFISTLTATAPDDNPRVPPVPSTGRYQPLSSCQWTLLPSLSASAADQQSKSKDILRVSHWA